jgi:poly-beta-hydroxyalkanoate depolymerase
MTIPAFAKFSLQANGRRQVTTDNFTHMQAGVGHYGVFSGRIWQQQIYPMVKNVILQSG